LHNSNTQNILGNNIIEEGFIKLHDIERALKDDMKRFIAAQPQNAL
jgi:hypothetical protein